MEEKGGWPKHYAPTSTLICDLAKQGCIRFSRHATQRCLSKGIAFGDVETGLSSSVHIVEDYPEDQRGHSCLVECIDDNGEPIRCVCCVIEADSYHELELFIVTVFRPDDDD